MTNYMKADGPTILAGVVAGDTDAITEATRRIANGSKSSHMKAADLVIKGGTTTTAPAPVVKLAPAPKAPKSRKGTGVGGAHHTALRKQAWEWKREQFLKHGIKVTTDEAYAKFGTFRAKAAA